MYPTTMPDARTPDVKLWPHQARGSVAIDAAFEAGHRAVVVVAPTGGGKGTLAAHKLREAELRGERAIFIVHRAEIVADVYERVLRAGSTQVGRIWGRDQKRDIGARIQVATVDSLDEERLPMAQLVIIDETHRVMGARYRRIVQRYLESNSRVIGLSATPERLDGKGLGEVFTEMVTLATSAELVEAGIIVPPLIYTAPEDVLPDLDGVGTTGGDYSAADLDERVNQTRIIGGIVEQWFRRLYGVPTVAFAVNIKHSKAIVAAFREKGVAVEHIDGSMSDHDRGIIFDRFVAGETTVLSQCNLLCLDSETEILTSAGWVGINAMTPNHRVANWDSGNVTFERPIAIVRRDRAPGEEMVFARSARVNLRITADHSLVYQSAPTMPYRKATARDRIGKQSILPVSGTASAAKVVVRQKPRPLSVSRLRAAVTYNLINKNGFERAAARAEARRRVDRKLALRYKNPSELSLDECRFIGFWIGDGTTSRLSRGGIEYKLSQSERYDKIIAWVDALLARLGVHYIKRRTPPAMRAKKTIHWQVIWSLPRGTGGGCQERSGLFHIEPYLNKNGTRLLWGLNAEQFEALIEGFWFADGDHLDGMSVPRTRCICNTNTKLLDTLSAIGSARGYRTCISLGANHKINPRYKKIYILSLCRTHKARFVPGRLQLETEWKEERVWCVETRTKNIITRRAGRVLVLGNCEGVDIPSIKGVIMARPTKSLTIWLQSIGRSMRPFEGRTPIVLDHSGTSARPGFGYPHEDREWSLLGRAERGDGAAAPPPSRSCPQCRQLAPLGAKACPGCSFVFPLVARVVTEIESDLQLLKPKAARVAREPEAPMLTVPLPPTDREKRAALDGWRKLAARRNQPASWVAERYTNAYGEPLQALVERERAALDARAAREAAARALPPPVPPADDGPLEDLDV